MQHFCGSQHEQTLFYSVIAPGKDRVNSMFWCGSATVIRRDALLAVGGVLTDTVAEDFHTTIAMHAKGLRTRYHAETLAQGLAPHDLAAFLLQRHRWARDNLRVFRTPQNPLTCPRLTLAQRVSYLASLLAYFSGLQRLLMLAVLVFTLLTGILPLTASPLALAQLWLPWTLCSVVTSVGLARGTLGPTDSTQYGLMTMGIDTRAVVGLLGRGSSTCKVTPKAGIDEGGAAVLRVVPLLTATGGALLVAAALRAATALGVGPLPPLHGFALAIGAWELTWIVRTLAMLVRRHQLRAQYRFPVDLAGRVDDQVVRVVDLSPTGSAIEHIGHHSLGDTIHLSLGPPAADGRTHEVSLPGEVRSIVGLDGEQSRVGCRLGATTPAAVDRLVEYCYIVEPVHSLPAEQKAGHTRMDREDYPAAS
ncbi:MAG: glycosyltransferase [Actinobacteria bacterium]|nr:glycosyltransferase [Actinomycetota bacterium]